MTLLLAALSAVFALWVVLVLRLAVRSLLRTLRPGIPAPGLKERRAVAGLTLLLILLAAAFALALARIGR